MRLGWFFIAASLVAFAAQTFFGNALAAATEEDVHTVRAQHTYVREGVHEISGMLLVPSACHDLTVRAKDFDPQTTVLVFETWEQPYRTCAQDPVAKSFTVQVLAPQTITFKAIVDTTWRQLTLVERL